MTIKLFGNPGSTCTRKVLMVLGEKNAPFEFQVIDFMKGEHKGPEHTARQPFGQVPAIDHDGFALYESRAITRYLDAVLPGASLTPTDVKDRAVMEQWTSIETSNFTPQAMKIIYQDLFNKHFYNKPSDAAIVEEGRAGTGRVLDIVEKHLAGKEYLAGGMFSLADVNYMPYIQYLFAAGHGDLITSRPNVSAWWTRNSSRPTWKKVVS